MHEHPQILAEHVDALQCKRVEHKSAEQRNRGKPAGDFGVAAFYLPEKRSGCIFGRHINWRRRSLTELRDKSSSPNHARGPRRVTPPSTRIISPVVDRASATRYRIAFATSSTVGSR